jgi:putative DNA primase/helicase
LITAAEIAHGCGQGREKRTSTGWSTLCPVHDDHDPSLSIDEKDGHILVRCHVGCDQTRVIETLKARGLWPNGTAHNGNGNGGNGAMPGLTLAEFAKVKCLSAGFLAQHGVHEEKNALVFRYLTLDGQKAARQRIRLCLNGDASRRTFLWNRAEGRPVPYGLWLLEEARKRKVRELVLCEGESDALTFWNHDIAALGIPGADMCSILTEPHIRDFGTMVICKEPDAGGETFVKGMTGRLAELRFRGTVKVADYSRADIKDASALHVKHIDEAGAFVSEWTAVKELAEVVTLPIVGMMRRRLSDIAPEPVQWLWPNRIPLGKIVLFAGESDLGKSTVSLDLGARTSRGMAWPDGRRPFTAGGVLILTAEDGVADTVRPRMESLGADLDRIEVIDLIREPSRDGELKERGFNLTTDIPHLERALEESSDVRLVIIDPVSSYMGGTDTHKNADVRTILAPLGKLAEKYRATVIIITHLNKGSGSAKQRITGSIAFEAAARAAYLFARDPRDKDGALFLPMKNNLGPKDKGLSYRLEQSERGGVVIAWGAETDLRPDEVMAQEQENYKGEKLGRACALIREMCADGAAVPVAQLESRARELGIAEYSVNKARSVLGCKARRRGFGGDWLVSLPGGRNGAA